MWTQFWDMHSGGDTKEDFSQCYIEAPEKEAVIIFYNRFGHNPFRVTCTCCGEDYATNESKTLADATGYQRNCPYVVKEDRTLPDLDFYYCESDQIEVPEGYHIEKCQFGTYQTLEEYVKNDDVCVIYEADIKPEERIGEVPEQGFVWVE